MGKEKAASLKSSCIIAPTAPAIIVPLLVDVRFLTSYTSPFPNCTSVTNLLSMVLAATESDQGNKLVTQLSDQHILYTAILAEGTPPRAIPDPRPYKLALLTERPAAMDAVCDPCPCVSLGDWISPGGNSPLIR
ncbi:hypothetical protein H5410_015961 [Solanum commersonii]|uniref:Uncharacterized protein n=1 Tax=Solanum commersonii TaxID=4109 RepID=A0A9J5ZV62_SOLCO|nr:hypothetical protein H5410_015961 [Solanum commersonii]